MEATKILEGKSVAFKNEMLYVKGINYNELPNWQKRGVGIWYQNVEKEGFNLKTGERVKTIRREIVTEFDIPLGEEYKKWISSILEGSTHDD